MANQIDRLLEIIGTNEVARRLRIEPDKVLKLQPEVLEHTLREIAREQIILENHAKASQGLGEVAPSDTAKYYNAINKHLAISIPMQTGGRKYTGQAHYDYYEGRYDL